MARVQAQQDWLKNTSRCGAAFVLEVPCSKDQVGRLRVSHMEWSCRGCRQLQVGPHLGQHRDDRHHGRQALHELHILRLQGIRRDEEQAHVHAGVSHQCQGCLAVWIELMDQPLLQLILNVVQDGRARSSMVEPRCFLRTDAGLLDPRGLLG